MRLNKFLPFAILYFFLNSVGLPFGLTYIALLGPFFYAWVLLKRKRETLLPFFAFLLPFLLVHLLLIGAEMSEYIITLVNLTLVYCFCQAFYTWLRLPVDHERILRTILVINFIFCVLAMMLYFTPLRDWLWIRQDLTRGVENFYRLKLLTYEASYYAMLFAPVFVYFLLQYLLGQNRMNNSLLVLMLFLPLVLSFSMGVIGSLFLSGVACLLIHFKTLVPKRRVINSIITVGALGAIAGFVFLFFFRENPVAQRLLNFFTGEDTSGQGRTANAFILVSKILRENNSWWGIGLGQLDEQGASIIRAYYLYYDTTPVAIPNAVAETWLFFGWIGLVLRFAMEIFLFFYTRVWNNYYRLFLFFFIFLYQFTGSFITNAAEYVTWILAFTNVFPWFNHYPARNAVSLRSNAFMASPS